MNMKKKLAAVGMVLGLGIFAAAAPANAASSLSIGGTGSLLAKGLAADVNYSVVCDEGLVFNFNAQIRQKINNKNIAIGGSDTPFTECTGEIQTGTLTLRIDNFDPNRVAVFKNGTALLTGNLLTCNSEGACDFITFNEEIRLKNN
jgi:hypothetical protein